MIYMHTHRHFQFKNNKINNNKNLAITNRSCVSCAHNTSMASIIIPWPCNLS